ncbi:hypothetical protein U5N25_03665 [Exiguobacterium indicum]|uniref:hypothetical protein n=1 Tax=Exiguobacterium indicum TaxID=296995 RepID=UPI00397A512A
MIQMTTTEAVEKLPTLSNLPETELAAALTRSIIEVEQRFLVKQIPVPLPVPEAIKLAVCYLVMDEAVPKVKSIERSDYKETLDTSGQYLNKALLFLEPYLNPPEPEPESSGVVFL